jgi:hypothetical protein
MLASYPRASLVHQLFVQPPAQFPVPNYSQLKYMYSRKAPTIWPAPITPIRCTPAARTIGEALNRRHCEAIDRRKTCVGVRESDMTDEGEGDGRTECDTLCCLAFYLSLQLSQACHCRPDAGRNLGPEPSPRRVESRVSPSTTLSRQPTNI